jgi:hypothetical protein
VIEQALEQSTAVIVVIGRQWATIADDQGRRLDAAEDYVRTEVTTALSKKKPILPVLVDGARMPSRSELPADLADFAQYNALELTSSRWKYDLGRLIEALESVGASPGPLVAFPGLQGSDRAEQRDAWLVSGDLPKVRERVEAFAGSYGLRSRGWTGDVLELAGGSKIGTRILGGFIVPKRMLPKTARIRLSNRGPKILVEALIYENLGTGVFAGMGPRYKSAFEKWMSDLRRETGAAAY